MKLTAVDRWAGTDRAFNRQAADAVYKAMTGMDGDAALVYGRILVAGGVRYDLIAHRAELTKAAGDLVAARARTLRDHYSRAAVAKARRGQDNTHEVTCLVAISKADGFNFSTAQRQQFASLRHREGGRFVQEHHKINTDETQAPMDNVTERVQGIPRADDTLKGKDRTHYQQAYQQIQDMLAPFHHEDLGAILHLKIRNGSGVERNVQFAVPPAGRPMAEIQQHLKTNDTIESAAVSVTPAVSAPGATFDTLSALTRNPRIAGVATDAFGSADRPGALDVGRMGQYNSASYRPGRDRNEDFSGTTRALGSLSRGSALLQDSLGDAAPPQLKYALAVANHVGQFGPEAQKVIGPAADRAAYRYRGTERTPDPALRRAFADVRGAPGSIKGDAFRAKVVYGTDEIVGNRKDWNSGPVLRYFQQHLPNPDLNDLQRRSGVIPPSEGIIIDDAGRIAHQSVGYADDWYLPFNLNHLSALKGGEYIRTRSFGGPTTEDIYTGLLSGARSLTVVSHNGVYTVDFDRNLRGGRRFNDKAASMVARYGQLLDALRSKQVERGGISGSRMDELRDKAGEYGDGEFSEAFQSRMRQLKADEQRKPVLSQQERDETAENWLSERAARFTTNGRDTTGDELTNQLINNSAQDRYQAAKVYSDQAGQPPLGSLADYQAKVNSEVRTGTVEQQVRNIAAMIGDGEGRHVDAAMGRAERTNRDRVTPLRLDGKGYFDALNALQEQFPYYLDKPVYHPWTGAGGAHTGARDTGYVAPRFNRPEEAEAGYFNTDVNGYGKVSAQSIRFQNYRVHGGKLKELRTNQPAERSDAGGVGGGDENAVSSGGGVGGGVGGNTGGTARLRLIQPGGARRVSAPVISDDEMRRGADLEMLDHLLAKTKFDGGSITGVDVTGADIRNEVNAEAFPHPALTQLYSDNISRAELARDPGLHELLTEVLNATTVGREKVFAVPERLKAQFFDGGRTFQPTPMPGDLSSMLSEVAQDHTFQGAAYNPGMNVSADAIKRAYDAEPSVRRLVDNGLLPAIDDPKYTDRIPEVLEQLNTSAEGYRRAQRQSGQVNPNAYRADQFAGEGLLRATQLRRRWEDAVLRQPKPTPPPESAGDSYRNEVHVHIDPKNITPEELDDYIRQAGSHIAADPNQRKTIDSL